MFENFLIYFFPKIQKKFLIYFLHNNKKKTNLSIKSKFEFLLESEDSKKLLQKYFFHLEMKHS